MTIHPDAPIDNSKHDLLQRATYARGIAAKLASYAPSDSVVISLVGAWGTGKSSLINMVLEFLPSADNGGPVVVRFNPWRYSGSERLFASFFSTLAKSLGAYGEIAAFKEATKTLRQLSKALAYLSIVPKAGNFLSKVSEYLRSGSEHIDSVIADASTLDALHDDLARELSRLKRRILVIIDDIDRLAPSEVVQMFQLVKSLADFPYVMYLLAFDEDVILNAVAAPNISESRRYLEKIVTLPIPVPPIRRDVLDNMVLGEILELLRSELPRFFNEERLFEQFASGFRRYFRTLRDVRRYMNMFAFGYGSGRHRLDIGDLAALTAIQVFEPALFERIPAFPDAFIDNDTAVWRGDRNEPTQNKDRIERLLSETTLVNREVAVDTLRQVFYKVDLAYKGHAYNFSRSEYDEQHRLCSPAHFSDYFSAGVGPAEMIADEYEMARSMLSGSTRDLLSYLDGVGLDKTADFVDKLGHDKVLSTLSSPQRTIALCSLFAVSDRYAQRIVSGGFIPFDWKIGYATHKVLDGVGPSEQYNILQNAIEQCQTGLGEAVAYIDLVRRVREKEDGRGPSLSADDVKSLQTLASEKVREALSNGALDSDAHLGRLIQCLRDWGMGELVSEVCQRVRQNWEMLLSFLLSSRMRQSFEGFLQPKPMRFDLDFVSSVIPLPEAIAEMERLRARDCGDDNQRRVIDSFIQQVQAPEGDED